MKSLCLGLLLLLAPAWGNPPAMNCEELSRKTEQTFRKMDEAIKLKSGMLLGEMEAAKGALEGCIDQNKAISTNMAMIWFLTDAGLLASLGLILFHQRRMRRAVRALSALVRVRDPEHPVEYVPSLGLYRSALLFLGVTLGLVNVIALFL